MHLKYVALYLLLVVGSSSACENADDLVDEKGVVHEAERFKAINHFMLLSAIVEQIGPASRYVADNTKRLEWDVKDGSVFYVEVGSSCGKPNAVGFMRPVS